MNENSKQGWNFTKLDELGFVGRGKSKHRPRDAPQLYNGPYPFIQTGDIKHSNLYITEYTQTYSEIGLAQSKLWKKGTLCITIAANIADTAILGFDACFPDSVIGFIPDESKADVRFMKYLFSTFQTRYKKISQGAAQDNLSQEKLLSLKFPIPSLQIQTKIADILSAYDSLIENNRLRIQLLEHAAQLLYREWFIYLRFPGHEHVRIIDGVPEGWEKTTNGMVCAILNDGDWIESKDQGGDDFRLLQVSNIGINEFIETGNFRYITEETFKRLRCQEVMPGDILISRMPTPIGRAWYVTKMPWRMITAVDVAIAKPDKEKAETFFLLYHLNSKRNIELSEKHATGATRPRISKKNLANLPILIPPLMLQKVFCDYVSYNIKLKTKLEQQNSYLIKARELLLPRLMNGVIPV